MRYVLILLIFCSCGSRFHVQRYQHFTDKANEHLKKAVQHGAKISTDTLYKSLQVKFPEINVRYETKLIPSDKDTLYFDRDGVETKIIFTRDNVGQPKEVRPEVKVLQKVKIIKVPYKVNQEIKCEKVNKFKIFMFGFLAGLVLSTAAGFVWWLKS